MKAISMRVGDVWQSPRGRNFRILRWVDGEPWKAVSWNETFKHEDLLIWPIACDNWRLMERGNGEERVAK
jgi:hypothetical protein